MESRYIFFASEKAPEQREKKNCHGSLEWSFELKLFKTRFKDQDKDYHDWYK